MEKLTQNIINLYGEQGQQWLNNLPSRVYKIKEAYHLSKLEPLKNLTYNYVLSGFQNNQPIILKLGLDQKGLQQEIETLKAFSGYGVANILSTGKDFFLQVRAVPGNTLKKYFPEKEKEAIELISQLIPKLHQAPLPLNHAFEHIQDWLLALDKTWDIPLEFLKKARELRDDLLKTSNQDVLLHGDLHHDNILQSEHKWLIIDPKGIIGDPTYEIAAFIRNPIPELLTYSHATSIIQNRIALFSKFLKFPQKRIMQWCFVQSVLAWIWALEDNSNTTYFKNLTPLFEALIDGK